MVDFTGVMATIPTTDVEGAKRFYEGTLGLKQVGENPGGVIYDVAGTKVFVYMTSAGGGEATRLALTVADVVADVAELKAKGVTFEVYPDLPMTTWQGEIAEFTDPSGSMPPMKSAWFKDPDGNILALGDAM